MLLKDFNVFISLRSSVSNNCVQIEAENVSEKRKDHSYTNAKSGQLDQQDHVKIDEFLKCKQMRALPKKRREVNYYSS